MACCLRSSPQSSSFLGRLQVKPSGSGDENELWMNSTIVALMRNMTMIFKKAKDNKFGHHWRLYCSLRNRVNCNITKYYANLINSRLSRKWEGILEISQGNPFYFWAIFTYCKYRCGRDSFYISSINCNCSQLFLC